MTQLNLINLKNVFVYEIGLIAIREVSPPFNKEQQYGRPYQPKHSPSLLIRVICCFVSTGLTQWDEDDILAQVMAQSQQEYLDSLRKNANATSDS